MYCLSKRKMKEKLNRQEMEKLLELNRCRSLDELCAKNLMDVKNNHIDLKDCHNRYLWFIEDEELETILIETKSKYSSKNNKFNEKEFFRNRIDILKMILDTSFNGISTKEWMEREIAR